MIARDSLRVAPVKHKRKSQQSQRNTNGFTCSRPRHTRFHLVDSLLLVLFPTAAIAGSVLGLNFLGDALRDQLDPRMRLEMGL